MKIGQHTFKSNLIQGPLAGYSCAPMRVQAWKFSSPAYCCTEMLSATHLVHSKFNNPRFTFRDEREGALSVQLSGNNAEILGRATKKITELNNPEIIDLNCGCPVPKIRAKNAGSKLLVQHDLLSSMIKAMKDNTDAAITIKIRVEGDRKDHSNIEVAQLIESAGADAIVVHGRHWTERYDVPCRYDQIEEVVKAVDIPVVGNGDVEDLQSFKKLLNTGCVGAMISRASLGQPWLFAQIEAEAAGKAFELPGYHIAKQVYLDHVKELAALEGEFKAVLQARSMAKYYFRRVSEENLVEKLVHCESLLSLREMLSI